MRIAFALIVLAVGSVVFHLLSPWWWTPIASNWDYIDHTITLTFWITGSVFLAIVLFMAYCLLRFRHETGTRAAYEPENRRLESWLTLLTSAGVAALLTPGLFVWHRFVTVPKDADVVEIIGQQWQWSFRLPGKDGILGTSDTRNISPENPLGLNPKDPHGQDDILIEGGDLHLPINRPVRILLRSIDTIHDFYVPEFRAKMDAVPGTVTYYWLTPTRSGTFTAICAELCGTGHYTMRGTVVVDEAGAYQAWLQAQSTFQQTLADAASRARQRSRVAATETGSTEHVQ